MNKKAEAFKKFLEDNKIEAFRQQEVPEDQFETAVYRSNLEIEGVRLPVIVLLDNSVYTIIRVLVCEKAVKENSKAELQELMNKYNKGYKPLKFYIDDQESLVCDCVLTLKNDENDSALVYELLINVVLRLLQENYKEIMKTIWK